MNKKLFGGLVASSLVGALTASAAFAAEKPAKGKHAPKHYCAPGCKGKSECKAHDNANCAGKNECKGHGVIQVGKLKKGEKAEDVCVTKGGVWTAEEESAATDAPAAEPTKK